MSWNNIKIDLNKINAWRFITIILAVILIIFMWTGYGLNNQLKQQVLAISEYQKDSITFTKTINKLGQEVSAQKSIVTIRTKEIQSVLLAKDSKIKKLENQIKVKANTEINNIKIGWVDKPIDSKSNFDYSLSMDTISNIYMDTSDLDCIPIGTKFHKVDEWYSLSGKVLKGGLNIESLKVINKATYNLGYEKEGLLYVFKKDEFILEVIQKNPYTETTAIKNIKLESPPKKWYKTTAFKVGVGFIGGILILNAVN